MIEQRHLQTDDSGATSAATSDGDDARGEEQYAEIYELTGYVEFWFGTRPDSIAGQLNPTLELEAGEQYKIRWTNGDGLAHSFIIQNANGEWIGGTRLAEGVGTTRELTFTATEEMSEYFCTVHPGQMRGQIRVNGQTDQNPGADVPDDLSPVTAESTVTFNAQSVADGEVVADRATLPVGGFVTIHTPRLMAKNHHPRDVRDIKKSVVGVSEYLEPGTHESIPIAVEDPASKYKTLIAMNHRDTNDNQTYDYVTDGPEFADADWPYFTPRGKAVIDKAPISKSEQS